jgi:hypothetical protein
MILLTILGPVAGENAAPDIFNCARPSGYPSGAAARYLPFRGGETRRMPSSRAAYFRGYRKRQKEAVKL